MSLESRALVEEAVEVEQALREGRAVMRDRYARCRTRKPAPRRTSSSGQTPPQTTSASLTQRMRRQLTGVIFFGIRSSRFCSGARVVIHQTGEFERAHQHGAVAAYGVGGLRAESARLDAIGLRRGQRLLAQRIDGAARIAERTVNPIGALHDEGEIRPYLPGGPAFAHSGKSEHEQKVGIALRAALKAQANPGRRVPRFALAASALVAPIDASFDGARKMRPEVAVRGRQTVRGCRLRRAPPTATPAATAAAATAAAAAMRAEPA